MKFCLRKKDIDKKCFGYNLLAHRLSYLSYNLMDYSAVSI